MYTNPLLYSRKKLDPVHIQADFLKPYLATEAQAAIIERETPFISYRLDERILQNDLLKKNTGKGCLKSVN